MLWQYGAHKPLFCVLGPGEAIDAKLVFEGVQNVEWGSGFVSKVEKECRGTNSLLYLKIP